MNKPFTPYQKNEPKEMVADLATVRSTSLSIIWKTVLLTVFMLGFLLSYNNAFAQNGGYCTMVCNDNLNVSVGNNCEVTILYDMILEDGDNSYSCSPNGPSAFKIEIMDENLNVLPSSPSIPYEYVGRTLTVKVKHWWTGNSCWSTITLQDKIPPRLTCPADISVACTQSTDPDVTGRPTISDCGSGTTLTYEDIYTDLDCGNPVGKYTRIWTAVDQQGNKSQCTQVISITRPDVNAISFPQNRDGLTKPAISCIDVAANSNLTSPEYTGYPTINGKPVNTTTGDVCKLNADYKDQIINACSGSYKIIRTWTVLNWCTSELKNAVQIIKVEDTTPPTVVAPADLTIGTQTLSCSTSVPLLPAQVSDACSDDISVKITSPFNTINSNGGTLLDVPVGTHLITYEATDACGNTASSSMKLTIVDDDPPVVVCNDETVVALTSDGTALVYAESFDDSSYDNCCLESILVRRMGDATFGPSVTFICSDAEVMIELQAKDCYGNVNTCMVSARVQDKVEPVIVCPADQTVDCESDYSDLSIFGQPQVVDNCGFEIVESSVSDIDNCGVGTIKRTWTAMGAGGGGVTACTQTITVINATPWNLNNDQITWPKDYETSECLTTSALDPEDLPAGFDKPTFFGDNGCSLVATNHEDLVLDIQPPACFKILRTWTVVDWCNYDPNSGSESGRYTFEQIIKVIDNTDPTFASAPTDFTVDMLDGGCGGTVTIPNVGVSDCSPNATITAQGALGNGFGPFTNVMPGVYDTKYIATDGCGNSITKDVKITVRDAKKPTPICLDGLTITLMPANPSAGTPAMVDLWAKDLNSKSFDNCTAEQNLQYTIRKYEPNSTVAPGATKVTFTCTELGDQEVEVWVIDANGNADFCITTVTIQDNMNACGSGVVDPDGQVALSGKIQTEMGDPISEVKVQITDPSKEPYITGDDGTFRYEQLDGDVDYALIPEKDIDVKNGISTFDIIKIRKHILNTERFDSPYKMIAADVDRSGSVSTLDLIQTQKLILGKLDEFPNNESWRFVSKEYVFEENGVPLKEDFLEIALVPKDSRRKDQVDFVAVKVGDVDYSAKANGLMEATSRNTNPDLFLDIEDKRFTTGEIVEVTFNANQFEAVLGYQFELKFDENVVDYQSVRTKGIQTLNDNNFGWNNLEKGLIKTSWDQSEALSLADGTALFTFRFKAKQAGTLSEVLTLTNGTLAPQAYTDYDEIYDVKLKFNETKVVVEKTELFQNQPNPFNTRTTIQFNLPTAQKATLTIFDVSGKVLKQYEEDYAKGQHIITVEKSDLPNVGLMYYALETANDRMVRKMIVLQK